MSNIFNVQMIISNTAVISNCYNYLIHIGILYVPPSPGNFFTDLPAFFFFFKKTIHFMKGINVLFCVGRDDKLAQTRRLTDNRHLFLPSAGGCDLTGLASSSYQDTSITMGIPSSGPNPTLITSQRSDPFIPSH